MDPTRPSEAEPQVVRPGEGLPHGYPTWILEPPPPRLRFQHRYRKHVILFLLTLLTTSYAGSCHYLSFEATVAGQFGTGGEPPAPVDLSFLEALVALAQGLVQLVVFLTGGLAGGLWYSVPLLAILAAHEFGHYYYCRVHKVDATLPFFLPFPIAFTGTLGAVIRIKEAFPSKQALFDIGVAGPIAGFVVLVPFLWWGMAWSAVVRFPEDSADVLYFGEPLLLQAVAWLQFGDLPAGHDLTLHPMGFAAWFGLLATALNLLPFGQLDGGHIAYAVFGRRAALVSAATLVTAMVLFFTQSSSWFFVALMMLVMALLLGLRHPRVIDEHTPLDRRRQLVALLALVIFVLSFTPVPISDLTGW